MWRGGAARSTGSDVALPRGNPVVLLAHVKINTVVTTDTASGRSDAQPTMLEPRRTRMTNRRITAIVTAYEAGKSSKQIASEMHIAKSTVLKVLRSRGVEIRPPGRAR